MVRSRSPTHILTREERRRGGRKSTGSFTKGSDRARQAGRKGGRATARKYGDEFYQKIGSQGGKASHNPR